MRDRISSMIGVSRQASSVSVKNVLSPLLWMCAALSPTVVAIAGLSGFDSVISYLCVGFLLFVYVCVLVAYAYFALTDPQKLQSENYQLRSQELRMLEAKSGSPIESSSDLVEIENPEISASSLEDRRDHR